MKFIVSGKNVEVTESLRDKVTTKLGKLDKFINPGTEVHVTMSLRKENHKELHVVEITVLYHGVFIRAEESSEDMYNSINKAIETLEKQVKKNRTRLERKKHTGGSLRFEGLSENSDTEPVTMAEAEAEAEEEYKIIRSKKFAAKPMDLDEAILQMNLLGHSFFVFYNAHDNRPNVVYRRQDGNYGLIEPEH